MIDIIIPAYNAHKTLDKTIESISKQTNKKDLKIYIINDGSKENYSKITKKYSEILDITEIEIENSGPGAARQIGLDSSNNEYIVFIDADDILYNENSILNLLNIIHNNDLAQGHFIEETITKKINRKPQYCYLHGKMFRRSIINKNKIKFDKKMRYNGDIYEDTTFNQLYHLYCDNIATTEEIIYIYKYNKSSITKSHEDEYQHLLNYVDAMTWLSNEIENRNINKNHEIAWNYCIILFQIYFKFLITPDRNTEFDFKSIKKIKNLYNKFIDYLPYEEQVNIYKSFDYQIIPPISFYDFLKKE